MSFASELEHARKERADRRDHRDGEDPHRRIPLVRERPNHYGEQAAKTAENADRQRQRRGELLFSLQLAIVAVLQKVKVERLHCRLRLSSIRASEGRTGGHVRGDGWTPNPRCLVGKIMFLPTPLEHLGGSETIGLTAVFAVMRGLKPMTRKPLAWIASAACDGHHKGTLSNRRFVLCAEMSRRNLTGATLTCRLSLDQSLLDNGAE